MSEKYTNNFLKEVEQNVEEGDWVKMCMQCGVCAGSCPLGPHWAHPPQELFMMIRANKREEVLTSDSMWMCTSCYNCIARCPRELPITHIMHGLARYAKVQGLAPKNQPTAKFGQLFWDNLMKKGRVNELKLGVALYFMNVLSKGSRLHLPNLDWVWRWSRLDAWTQWRFSAVTVSRILAACRRSSRKRRSWKQLALSLN
jgi:quinone-modifying oxidoreductase subunit QmoC